MKRTDLTSNTTYNNSAAPSQDEIALRAHQLWVQQGCPQGHDLDNWLEAEREVLSEFENRRSRIPASEEVGTSRLEKDEGPFTALSDEAPLATKVEQELVQPGRPGDGQSPTSMDL